jgi:uncharacterized protein (TIGR03066 family)
MHALQQLATGLLLVELAFTLPAGEAKADAGKKLVGVWEVVKAEQGALPVGSTVDFAKDGKAKVTAVRDGKESTAEGTYAVDGTKLTVTLKHGEKEVKHAITIKKLTDTEFVTENEKGKTAEFKRKK